MIKYIAYCRKSTDEKEKQVLSIESQIAELKEFAAKEKLNVVEFLTESRTAKIPGRPVFDEVIKKIEQGEANGILAWHADRLARNSIDGGKIIYLLDTGKILDLKFPTFWFDNTPQGKFMLSIAFGQSKYYVDNLSENVKRDNRQKLRKGVFPSKAPLGYFNEPRLRTIEVNPNTSKIIKQVFENYSTGNFTTADIQRFLFEKGIARKNGKPLAFSHVQKILNNTFYYGLMKYAGEFYEGVHTPLITKKTFEKVQEIQKQKGKPRKQKHNFPFTGLAKCGECGGAITAEEKTKCYPRTRGKVDYIYYRCTKKSHYCSQKYVAGEIFEQQLRGIIGKASLPKSWAALWLEKLEKEENEEKANKHEKISKISLEVVQIDQKLDRLLEGYLDQIVDPQMYQKKKQELIDGKIKLKEKMASISKNGDEWLGLMKEFIEVAAAAATTACAKNNRDELKFIAQKVGSDYQIFNKVLNCKYERGFAALAAGAGAASALPDNPRSPFLWIV